MSAILVISFLLTVPCLPMHFNPDVESDYFRPLCFRIVTFQEIKFNFGGKRVQNSARIRLLLSLVFFGNNICLERG